MRVLCTTPRCNLTAELSRGAPVLEGLQRLATAELAAATEREQSAVYTDSVTLC